MAGSPPLRYSRTLSQLSDSLIPAPLNPTSPALRGYSPVATHSPSQAGPVDSPHHLPNFSASPTTSDLPHNGLFTGIHNGSASGHIESSREFSQLSQPMSSPPTSPPLFQSPLSANGPTPPLAYKNTDTNRQISDSHSLEPPRDHHVSNASSLHAPDRTISGASQSTVPRSLFRDFDGVHLSDKSQHPATASVSSQHEHADKETHMDDTIPPASSPNPSNVENSVAGEHTDLFAALQGQEEDTGLRLHDADTLQALTARPRASQMPIRSWTEPPPAEDMIYYPAPVPMHLNLPKRLSKLPKGPSQAARKSRLIGQLPPEARMSAPWLPRSDTQSPDLDLESSATQAGVPRPRHSTADFKRLPPQLRASVYFDHEALPQQVELKYGSAMATLESLLDASASAPADAFLGPNHANHGTRARRSTTSFLEAKSDGRLSRASMLDVQSEAAADISSVANMMSDGRASRLSSQQSADNLGQRARKSRSRLSMANDIRLVSKSSATLREDSEHDGDEEPETSLLRDHSSSPVPVGDYLHVAGEPPPENQEGESQALEQGEVIDPLEEELASGPPTTLLAELQLRKAKLRQRTRNAPTSFPNGMHSTLLQMEEVAKIEKRRRNNKPTTLAWEDPHALGIDIDEGDDEVPLGVLYPGQNTLLGRTAGRGQNDWDKPLGLIEARDREVNEPLSARRYRLKGISPAQVRQMRSQAMSPNVYQGAGAQAEDEHSEHEDETLAQRTRRLRTRKALDDAIGDAGGATPGRPKSRAISDDFASEMMSQLGVPEALEQDNKVDKRGSAEGETLGQRRRRLQAEAASRQASGGSTQVPQALRQSKSVTNILAAAPANVVGIRNVSGESQQSGGLLGQNELRRAYAKAQLQETNWRSSSGQGLASPLVSLPPDTKYAFDRGGAGSRQSFAQGMYNDGSGGLLARSSTMLPQQGWGIPQNTFAQGFGAVRGPQNPLHQLPPLQSPAPRHMPQSPPAEAALVAQASVPAIYSPQAQRHSRVPSGHFGGTYAAAAMPRENEDTSPMSPLQRDTIDRWRMSVQP